MAVEIIYDLFTFGAVCSAENRGQSKFFWRNVLFTGGLFAIIKRKTLGCAWTLKYGTWKVAAPDDGVVQRLCAAGYAPLTALVLSGRGCRTPEQAHELLGTDGALADPLEMKEMERAVAVIRRALEKKKKIAVFGDYDVDGITATCLLTDYLRGLGADCGFHIPGRIEEGYGLNSAAIEQLAAQGVELIISVDCGITAIEEAQLCRRLGVELVITDHHECKPQLPEAAAVVDPHRADRTYPHTDLSGVGIAFKLAAALEGDQDAIARRYCDLFCLGTIADVMPLRGENRRLVTEGLQALQRPERLGLRALINACDCGKQAITAATIGYVLAPRINAAGRMEHAELAVQLFLSKDPAEAERLAQTLCRLNRERQTTEAEIYREASEKLKKTHCADRAIVLAGENWHQGVIGIVASRLCEEYCRPTFLICLNGEHGKASSRSYGGFDLFRSLTELAPLLEDFGGHEFAAGFTIARGNIDEFRRQICRRAEEYSAGGAAKPTLEVDCEAPEALLTEANINGLAQLEPCGTGCPKPVFCMSELEIERVGAVGGGKHLKLRLKTRRGASLQAIFFSAGSLTEELAVGDRVDVACHLQINEFRDTRTVQLSLLDLRPASATALFDRFAAGTPLTAAERAALAPERDDVAAVWRYLKKHAPRNGQWARAELNGLARRVAAAAPGHSLRRTVPCLAILSELGLIGLQREGESAAVRLVPDAAANQLENSKLYQALHA